MQIEVIESVTKTIGSLALAYPSLRRLGVADIIDALTTKGKERHVSTGQVIEILVLNRLSLRPTPISRIDAWAQSQAVEEVYSLAADALNDDRIGRALEEVHPHRVDAWAALVLRGAQTYGVQLGQLHSDVTRLAFEGSYDEVPAQTMDGHPVAKITYGYTGKEDPIGKQLTLSLSVAADGGIPAWYRLADGNAADTRAYLAHLTAVRERLQLDKPLVVAARIEPRRQQVDHARQHAGLLPGWCPLYRSYELEGDRSVEPAPAVGSGRVAAPFGRTGRRAGTERWAVLGFGATRSAARPRAGHPVCPAAPVCAAPGRPQGRAAPARQGSGAGAARPVDHQRTARESTL